MKRWYTLPITASGSDFTQLTLVELLVGAGASTCP